jgi:DNA-binding IclR family transcriptional regulator
MTDITQNKHNGNANSAAAYETIADTLTNRQNDVLSALLRHPAGMTSKEIADWLESPLNAISGRISELKAMGRIRESGRRDGCAVLVMANTTLPEGDVLDQLRTAWHAADREERQAIKITVDALKRDNPAERETVKRRIKAHLKTNENV